MPSLNKTATQTFFHGNSKKMEHVNWDIYYYNRDYSDSFHCIKIHQQIREKFILI